MPVASRDDSRFITTSLDLVAATDPIPIRIYGIAEGLTHPGVGRLEDLLPDRWHMLYSGGAPFTIAALPSTSVAVT
jgi:hypothetical protein